MDNTINSMDQEASNFDYTFKVTEQEANEVISKYLRAITDIIDTQIKYNVEGCTALDTIIYHGREIKRLREIKLMKYMDLLFQALHFDGYKVDMIKQVYEKNENDEYEPVFICYINLLKRVRT